MSDCDEKQYDCHLTSLTDNPGFLFTEASKSSLSSRGTVGLDVASFIIKVLCNEPSLRRWLRRFLTSHNNQLCTIQLLALNLSMASASVASSRSSYYSSISQHNLPSSTSITLSNSPAASFKVSSDLEDEGVSCPFYASIKISIFISCSRE